MRWAWRGRPRTRGRPCSKQGAASMRCAPCPAEGDRRGSMMEQSRRSSSLLLKARPSTALVQSFGRSSAWLVLIERVYGVSSARPRSGASWVRSAFRYKSPSVVPSSATRRPCRPGSARPCRLKKARRQERLIVAIDESSISERPTRVRTWAPQRQNTRHPVPLQLDTHLGHRGDLAELLVSIARGLDQERTARRVLEGVARASRATPADHLRQPEGASQQARAQVPRLDRRRHSRWRRSCAAVLARTEPRWNTSGLGSSAMRWPTTALPTSASSVTQPAPSSKARNAVLRSSPHAGFRQDCGDVMIYGNINRCKRRSSGFFSTSLSAWSDNDLSRQSRNQTGNTMTAPPMAR